MTDMHLTDEQLSGFLDEERRTAPTGTDGSSVESHLSGCPACGRRLEQLAGARELVRQPVARVAPETLAAMVAHVIDEAMGRTPDGEVEELGGGAAGRAGAGGRAAVTELPPSSLRVRRLPNGRVLGGAAAALVLAAAISIPFVAGSQSSSNTAASSAGAAHRRLNAAQTPQSTAGSGVRDLGSVNSPAQLRSVLSGFAASVPSSSGSGYGGTAGRGPDSAATQRPSPAPEGEAPATGPTPEALGSPGMREAAVCLPDAVRADRAGLSLTFAATVVYQGTPSVVYVFSGTPSGTGPGTGSAGGSGANSDRLAVVTAASGCRVLLQTSV